MTDHGLELRLRGLYNAEASGAPERLRDRVLEIPAATARPRVVLSERSRMVALLAAAVLLSALLIGGGLLAASGSLPLPWVPRPVFADPASLDPCVVMTAYEVRNEYPDPGAISGWRFDHGGELTPWGARVCAYGYDGGWNDPHLLLLPVSMSLQEAEALLGSITFPDPDIEASLTGNWVRVAPGEWTRAEPGRDFHELAISADPYFFVLTASPAMDLRALAVEVLAALGDPAPGR